MSSYDDDYNDDEDPDLWMVHLAMTPTIAEAKADKEYREKIDFEKREKEQKLKVKSK